MTTETGWVYKIAAALVLLFVGIWLRCRDWSGKQKSRTTDDDDMLMVGWLMGDADEED